MTELNLNKVEKISGGNFPISGSCPSQAEESIWHKIGRMLA